MPAFDLNGKMSLDGSGFSKTLQKKKVEANAFRKELGTQFKAVGTGFLSGALASVGFGAVTGFFRSIVEEADGIRGISRELMVSSQEAAGLSDMAKQAGVSVSELTGNGEKLEEVLKRVRAAGAGASIVSDDELENIKILGDGVKTLGDQIKTAAATFLVGTATSNFNPKKILAASLRAQAELIGLGGKPKFDEEASAIAERDRRAEKIRKAKEQEKANEIQAAKDIDKLRESTAANEESLRRSRLTDTERLLEVEKEIAKLSTFKTGTPLENEEARNRVSFLRKEQNQLQKSLNQRDASSSAAIERDSAARQLEGLRSIDGRIGAQQSGADQLTRVGGFALGQSAKDGQIRELQKIKAELSSMKNSLQNIDRKADHEVGI